MAVQRAGLLGVLMLGLAFVLCGCAPVPGEAARLQVAQLPDGVEADIETLRSGTLDGAFVPVPDGVLQSSSARPRWFRLWLDEGWNELGQPVLTFAPLVTRTVTLHAPPDYSGRRISGVAWGGSEGSALRRGAVQVPSLAAGEPLYVRLGPRKTRQPMAARLHTFAAWHTAELAHVRALTMLMSVQLTMVLVAAGLWIALRERLFLLFVAYAGTQLIYMGAINGELPAWPGGALFGHELLLRVQWLAIALSGVFAISFIIEFCSLRARVPQLGRVLGHFRSPLLILGAAALVPHEFWSAAQDLARPLFNLTLLLSSLVAIAAVVLAVRRGDRPARFFLLAWMPQVLFTAFRVTQILMDWPQPLWLEYGFPMTMAFATVIIVLGLARTVLHARQERDLARRAAEQDGLTGVLNRNGLRRRLEQATARAREGEALSVLFLDLDHFKAINDRHGHLAGDRCLQAVAAAARGLLGPTRPLGRYGGEEFVAILPDTALPEALAIAEGLRAHVETLQVTPAQGEPPLQLTTSIGVACWLAGDETPDRLVRRADEALYRAKTGGRNRVVAAPCAALHQQELEISHARA